MRHTLRRPCRAGKIRASFIGFVIAVLMPAAVDAAPISGTCNPTKVTYVASSAISSTTSTSFVQIPEVRKAITQGGASASCVIVYFVADAAATTGSNIRIRLTIDGSTVGVLPGSDRQFIVSSTSYQTTAGSFILPSVAPGPHLIRMEYRSSNGSTVAVMKSNLTIHYAP